MRDTIVSGWCVVALFESISSVAAWSTPVPDGMAIHLRPRASVCNLVLSAIFICHHECKSSTLFTWRGTQSGLAANLACCLCVQRLISPPLPVAPAFNTV